MRLTVAAVQMTSRADVADNLARVRPLVERAAARGASLVVLPENFALMATDEDAKLAVAESVDAPTGPILSAMTALAQETRTWLVLGGMPEKVAGDPTRVHNACVVVDPDGRVAARYRKMHLFDVKTSDGIEYRESKAVAAGSDVVVAALPWGGLGLSICYDVRFPELYRELSRRGARVVVVPAAFTVPTGMAHWHLLLRARAVENQVFVVAAAQCGQNTPKRATYGHSLVVDPWGVPLAEAADGEGLAVAELDFAPQDEIRRDLPALTHRRM